MGNVCGNLSRGGGEKTNTPASSTMISSASSSPKAAKDLVKKNTTLSDKYYHHFVRRINEALQTCVVSTNNRKITSLNGIVKTKSIKSTVLMLDGYLRSLGSQVIIDYLVRGIKQKDINRKYIKYAAGDFLYFIAGLFISHHAMEINDEFNVLMKYFSSLLIKKFYRY